MKKLTKKEKTLLIAISQTTMGMISTTDSEVMMSAWRLSLKDLVKRYQTNLPFCGGIDYWFLTDKGWNIAKELE
jgi:hypothetical protein